MAGTISSLGIGSSVLTSSVIDQLKAADTANMITPIDNKITLQTQKASALDLLNSLLSTFKASTSSLADSTLYQQRNVSGNTSAVSVTAQAGTDIQSFAITDTVMAKKNVLESGAFTSDTAPVSSGSGTMNLAINGSNFNIAYTSSTTLTDLKQSINDAAGAKVTASILQTGTNEYHLVLTSKETGANQTITLSDSLGGTLKNELKTYDATTNPTGVQTLQTASDASFKYNGISITRPTNSVSDLIVGVSINLLQDGGSTNIAITQNTTAISDEMKNLSSGYNTLMKQLDDMTLADTANGKVGIFNGDNTIKAIKREVTQMITSVDSKGQSLGQYGISLNQDGTMTFTQSDFDAKMSADPAALESFFSGSTSVTGEHTVGVFGNLDALMNSYTSSSGLMSTLIDASKNTSTSLTDEKTRATALLNARYDTMTARFAAYDTMISQINNQFSSLSQQIAAMSKASG